MACLATECAKRTQTVNLLQAPQWTRNFGVQSSLAIQVRQCDRSMALVGYILAAKKTGVNRLRWSRAMCYYHRVSFHWVQSLLHLVKFFLGCDPPASQVAKADCHQWFPKWRTKDI